MINSITLTLALSLPPPPLQLQLRSAGGGRPVPATRLRSAGPRLCAASPAVLTKIQRVGAEAILCFSLSAGATGDALAEVGEAEGSPAALSLLLERDVPEALAAAMQSNGSSLRLLGQAQLAGESPEELLARFEPGEPLSLRMAAEVWPEVPLVQRSSYIGLTLRLRGREVEGAKREEALLELRRRFPRPDGSLPELDDQLAAEVSSGLTAAALRDLVEERGAPTATRRHTACPRSFSEPSCRSDSSARRRSPPAAPPSRRRRAAPPRLLGTPVLELWDPASGRRQRRRCSPPSQWTSPRRWSRRGRARSTRSAAGRRRPLDTSATRPRHVHDTSTPRPPHGRTTRLSLLPAAGGGGGARRGRSIAGGAP